MLRDASQKQVIQKFSFIESLNISRKVKASTGQITKAIDVEPAFDFIPQVSVKSQPQPSDELTSAIVAAGVKGVDLTVGEIVGHSTSERFLRDERSRDRHYLGKILFALAASYCLFVLWWLFGHQGNRMLVRIMGGKHISVAKSDLEFIDRLEQSLDAIDRQLQAETSNQDRDGEVVYVPVYTPKSTAPSLPQIPITPSPSTPTSAPVTVRANDPNPPSETLKIPAPPPLGDPTPMPSQSNTSTTTTRAIAKSNIKYTLIGILELGEGKSAALINVNGQTRRFWSGEEIGSSGWILDSIVNRTAKISYEGQVRSITVGDTF